MRLLLLLELMVVSASAVQLPGAGSEALAALLAKGLGGTAAQRISSSSEDLSTMLQQIVTKPIARHLGVAVAAAADGDGAAGFTRSELSFPCSGLQCSAWLFMPKQPIGGADKPPVIVMGHGLGGQKSWCVSRACQQQQTAHTVQRLNIARCPQAAEVCGGVCRRWLCGVCFRLPILGWQRGAAAAVDLAQAPAGGLGVSNQLRAGRFGVQG